MARWTPLTDAPIVSAAQDECGLAGFAKKIAPALVSAQSEHSLVVGLYAPWGQGKTSLLNLLETELAGLDGKDRPIIVRFNPWLYGSAETLLLSFFGSLSEALGSSPVVPWWTRKSVASAVRSVGAAAGPLITPASHIGGAAVNVGSAAAAELLATGEASFEKVRKRAARRLRELGRGDIRLRLVVLIDDLDRADVGEVFAMLRLVRLIADLPNATYVLAMDHARVSDIVARRMEATVSQSYLEKIVQVTINVPPLEPSLLQSLTQTAISRVVVESGLNAGSLWGGEDRWSRWYDKVIGEKVRSLRDRARFVNSIGFALSTDETLEIDAGDIVCICFLQTFFPATYERVRQSKGFLTAQFYSDDYSEHLANDKAPFKERRAREFVRIALGGNHPQVVPGDEKTYTGLKDGTAGALRVLLRLFPFALNPGSLNDTALIDARRANRVAVADRFDRYFQLVPPPNDVSDVDVNRILEAFASPQAGPDETKRDMIHELLRPFCVLNGSAPPTLIQKLADRLSEVPTENAVETAKSFLYAIPLMDEEDVSHAVGVLAVNADTEPKDGSANTRPHGRIIVRSLLRDLPSPLLALAIGQMYARDGLDRWERPSGGDKDFAGVAVSRIRQFVSDGTDVFAVVGASEGTGPVWQWARLLTVLEQPWDEIVDYLRKLILQDDRRIANVLGLVAAWSTSPSLASNYIKPVEALANLERLVGNDFLRGRIAGLPPDASGDRDPYGLIPQYQAMVEQAAKP